MMNIIDEIGEAACLESLAEESAELAQAALKKARKLRGDYPTPKTMDEINKDLEEEVSDVINAMRWLGLQANEDIIKAKNERYQARKLLLK